MQGKGMLESEIEALPMSAITTALLPTKRGIVFKNPMDIGVDAEYQDDLNLLVSYQFSILRDGQPFTRVFILNRVGGIEAEEFLDLLLRFITEVGIVKVPRTIYLISYAAAAELRYIRNYIDRFKLRESHTGLGWEGEFGEQVKVTGEIQRGKVKVKVIDLAGYYPRLGLTVLGEAVSHHKVSLKGVGGRDEQYWKSHMSELQHQYPEKFDEYARTDPEIVILTWQKLLEDNAPKRIDPHRFPTTPSLAMADFKLNWLRAPPVPARNLTVERVRRLKSGEWSIRPSPKTVFAGNVAARLMALESYWGGYNLAFVRGYKKEPQPFALFYDVVSLYVAASILQPLPNANTEWITDDEALSKWQQLEGYVRASFEFPPDTQHPNLPIMSELFQKLTFPLCGEGVFTIQEALVALQQGARVTPIRAVGFVPGSGEVEHDLAKYMRNVLDRKNRARKGTLQYIDSKLTMVSLIGKFDYRSRDYDVGSLQQFMWKSGVTPNDMRHVFANPATRNMLKMPKTVGTSWCPEWSSLILGHARSIVSQIAACGCYHISTDGGAFPIGAINRIMKLQCVKRLEDVGSGFRPEGETGEVDEMAIVRTRMYGTWRKGVPVHNANHSVHVKGDVWDDFLRWSIRLGRPAVHAYVSHRLAKPKDVLVRGKAERVFDEIAEPKSLNWHWDNKRALSTPAPNPFSGLTETHPHQFISDAINAERGGFQRRKRRAEPDIDKMVEERGITRASAYMRRWRERKKLL